MFAADEIISSLHGKVVADRKLFSGESCRRRRFRLASTPRLFVGRGIMMGPVMGLSVSNPFGFVMNLSEESARDSYSPCPSSLARDGSSAGNACLCFGTRAFLVATTTIATPSKTAKPEAMKNSSIGLAIDSVAKSSPP